MRYWYLMLFVGLLGLSGCTSSTPATPTASEQVAELIPTNTATMLPQTIVPATRQVASATIPPTKILAPASSTPTLEPTLAPTNSPTSLPTKIVNPTSPPTNPVIVPSSAPIEPTLAPTAEPAPPTSVPSSQFSYTFPIQPASAANFGNCHHDYPASDIFAATGTQVVAVTSGVIDFVSYSDQWDPANDDPALRGGLSIALVGDDGIRYYGSHLSAIADGIVVGLRVESGQLLGWVGQSGNARSTPAHLHFGISYPSSADDWATRRGTLNPVPYLLDWLNGINSTPDPSQDLGGAC